MKALLRDVLRRPHLHRPTDSVRLALSQLQAFEAVLNRHQRSFQRCSSLLDFGCGDGRLTRHLFRVAPQTRIAGCDVSAEAVATCQRRHPSGLFVKNAPTPPLLFSDAQFDLIYSYSVFTHFSESNHKAWLRELSRVLQPGGVMVHTVHSHVYVRRARMFSHDWIVKNKPSRYLEGFLQSTPDYYYVMNDAALPEYGLTVISKEYLVATWPQETGLTLLEYDEAAIEAYPEGCQDIVILEKAR